MSREEIIREIKRGIADCQRLLLLLEPGDITDKINSDLISAESQLDLYDD